MLTPIIPGPFNFISLPEDVRQTALVTFIEGRGQEDVPTQHDGEPLINSDITECPTDPGYDITQCPGGDYSHDALDAYDISVPQGQPVYSTHPGVVVATFNQSYTREGAGNYVKIKGTTPEGEVYYTIYEHLLVINVSTGDQVGPRHLLGLADTTGNSDGPHLHYEYRGADNIAKASHSVRFLLPTCGLGNPHNCSL